MTATAASKNAVSMIAIFTKISSTILKLVKSLKFVLAAGTFGAYTFLFTWKFALLVMFGVGIHELGHVYAMRKFGLKTKGFYFIPLLGGAAISEEAFRSGPEEAWVALWGPIFGILTVIPPLILYFLTQDPMWAAAASWLSAVNLFNLFPINPLDGGRVIKSLAFSFDSRLGIMFLTIGFALGIFLAHTFGLGLLLFVAIIGFMETQVGLFVALIIPFFLTNVILWVWYFFREGIEEANALAGFKNLFPGIWKIVKGKSTHKPAEFWYMTPQTKGVVLGTYLGLIILFLLVVVAFAHIPGADLAMQFLKDE